MKFLWLAAILWSSLLLAGSPDQDLNVNTRYTVESVELAGDNPGISTGLRGELMKPSWWAPSSIRRRSPIWPPASGASCTCGR